MALKYLAWVGQLGLLVVLPPVLALLGARWLCARYALGGWVYAAALALGLGCAAVQLGRFLRMMLKEAEHSARSEGRPHRP